MPSPGAAGGAKKQPMAGQIQPGAAPRYSGRLRSPVAPAATAHRMSPVKSTSCKFVPSQPMPSKSIARPGTRHASLPTATPLLLWLGLALLVIVADQITKTLVMAQFALGDSLPVTGYFNLVRAHNAGAAFSFLAGASGWQRWFFVGLGALASVFIVWMLRKHPGQRLFCAAISLVLGGALGNVIDRLLHGHVVDFLQFHWALLAPLFPGGYFPAFNIADSAITLGAAGLIADELRRVRRGG